MAKNDNVREIESLSPLEHVRLRSDVYVGDCSDATQLIIEILGNSIDEYNIGYGKEIIVKVDNKNHIYSVEDCGRGFPANELREDGETTLQASFDVLNTSGKFRNDGSYAGVSLGKNGQGGKLTNFLSHSMEVYSCRNYNYELVQFKEGVFQERKLGKSTKEHGTTVTFNPSEEFFDSPTINESKVKQFCNEITCLCPGLIIDYNGQKIFHENGIADLLSSQVKDNIEIVSNRFIEEFAYGKQGMSVGLTYTSSYSSSIISYVNCGLTNAGPHIASMKSTITRILNKWAKENNLLGDKDKNLDGASLQEGLILVSNITAENVKYEAQVKSTVTKIDTDFASIFGQKLEVWLDSNPEDAKAILEKAILARKAAEAAKRARAAVKNNKKRGNKVKILNPDKLKDAEFLGQDSTLLVVEGLSAGASMCVAREIDKYGILMLRGKLINALANKDDRLLKNEEIQLLFKALGIRPYEDYEETSLRYGRIGICVDSDSDGFHIGLLIASALEHFCPKFIRENRLCWLRSPLYIVKGKDKEQYYFTDQEMNAARPNLPAGVEVQRCKGLGSLSASQARNSMFGANQHMDVLIPTDKTKNKLVTLMGSNADGRKDFIFNNIDFSEVKE